MKLTINKIFPLLIFLTTFTITNAQNSCNKNYVLYGTPGNYTFTVPSGVTSISTFAIGGGGGGGAGSGGWGSAGGGGCGGGIAGSNISVTPGQNISLYVGWGGPGGNGSANPTAGGCPWCGTFSASTNGSIGGASGIIGSINAVGGSWGRGGYHNLYNAYSGGYGGGSGGGGGGNGWPGFSAVVGSGGTYGTQTNSQGAGGYCTGDGWGINPGTYITKIPWSAGVGGQEPYVASYYGGGGGGGIVLNNSTVKGFTAPGGCPFGCPGDGGNGYGGGGGGQGLDYQGAGGQGAPGAVYISWDGGTNNNSDDCSLSCNIISQPNKIEWTSNNAELFYINNIGYVGATGTAQVPDSSNYSGFVKSGSSTAICTNLSCTNGANNYPSCNVCPSGQSLLNGQCAVVPCASPTNSCGQTNSGTLTNGICSASAPSNPGPCTITNGCGQTQTGVSCQSGCVLDNGGQDINNSCFCDFSVSKTSIFPNGYVDFSWNICNTPGYSSSCSFLDTTDTPKPIFGLQNIQSAINKVRVSNIQKTTQLDLSCEFKRQSDGVVTGTASKSEWVRIIRLGEN